MKIKNNNKIIKPWGFEVLLEKNNIYVLKKLFMKKDHRCSLQYHKKKLETIYVLSGILEISFGKSKNNLSKKKFFKNDTITLKPKVIHRMKALKDCFYLESSSPQLKDVVRLEDDYRKL
jgi:mannose-6-phosphate isomerase-like protein (cupin superfamily)